MGLLIRRGWPFLVGAAGLFVAGAGLTHALEDGTAAAAQFDVAAAVLSVYTSAVCLLATDRAERTILSGLIWGGTIPALIGLGTMVVVFSHGQQLSDLLVGLPWLAGPLLSIPLATVLPGSLRYPLWGRTRDE